MKKLRKLLGLLALSTTTLLAQYFPPLGNSSGGGSVTIGNPVAGGHDNDVLFIGPTGNLDEDDAFNYITERGLYIQGSPIVPLTGGLFVGPDESTLTPDLQGYALGAGNGVGLTCIDQFACLGIEAQADTVGFTIPIYLADYQTQTGQSANGMEADAIVLTGVAGTGALGIVGYADVAAGTVDSVESFLSEEQCQYGGACLIDDGYVAQDHEAGVNANYSFHSQQGPGAHNYSFYSDGGAPLGIVRASGQTQDLIDLFDTNGTTVLMKADVNGNLYIVSQSALSGQRFACIDTNGQIISSVTACVGT